MKALACLGREVMLAARGAGCSNFVVLWCGCKELEKYSACKSSGAVMQETVCFLEALEDQSSEGCSGGLRKLMRTRGQGTILARDGGPGRKRNLTPRAVIRESKGSLTEYQQCTQTHAQQLKALRASAADWRRRAEKEVRSELGLGVIDASPVQMGQRLRDNGLWLAVRFSMLDRPSCV